MELTSSYFDTLLSLIPPKYYLRPEAGEDGDEDEAPDSKFHKNKKKAVTGAGTVKENTKKAIKRRYLQGAQAEGGGRCRRGERLGYVAGPRDCDGEVAHKSGQREAAARMRLNLRRPCPSHRRERQEHP